jgi:hypothetical protein
MFLQGVTGAAHEATFFCAQRDSKARGCEIPFSADFIDISRICSSSSQYRAANSLLDKQLIIRGEEQQRMYDAVSYTHLTLPTTPYV